MFYANMVIKKEGKVMGNKYDYRQLREFINANHDRFSELNYDTSLSTTQKMNSLVEWFKVLLKEYNDWVEYLDNFIENFDEKLYSTIDDILKKWIADGLFETLLNEVFEGQNNKIDQAIRDQNTKLSQQDTKINQINDTKVNKNGVGEVQYNNLSNEIKQKFTGGSVAVVGPDSVSDTEVINDSLTAFKKLKDIKFNGVLFSSLPSEIVEVDGYYDMQGNFTASSQHKTSNLIPVKQGSISINSKNNLSGSFTRIITFWDKNGAFISGNSGLKLNLITVPTNAYSFRVALRKEDDGDIIVTSFLSNKKFNTVGISPTNQNLNMYGHLPTITNTQSLEKPFFIIDTTTNKIKLNSELYGTSMTLNAGFKNYQIFVSEQIFSEQTYTPTQHAYFWYNVDTMQIIMSQSIGSYATNESDFINLGMIPNLTKNNHSLRTFRLSYSVDGNYYQGSTINPFFQSTKTAMYFSRQVEFDLLIDRKSKKITLKNGGRHFIFTGNEFVNIVNSQGELIYTFDDEYTILTPTAYTYLFVEINKKFSSTEISTGKLKTLDSSLLNNMTIPSNWYCVGVVSSEFSYVLGNYKDVDSYSDATNLKGVKVVSNGDSIMVSSQTRYDETFNSYIALSSQRLGFTLSNHAISGSTVAVKTETPTERSPLVTRVNQMDQNADIVIICIGTNDWRYQWTPFGDFDSRDNSTFYGALHNTITQLKERYPEKRIIFMTCMKRGGYLEKNELGLTLEQYNEAIKKVCSYNSIEVWDTYNESMINPHINADMVRDCPDGTHPNSNGHKNKVEPWFSSKISVIRV